MTHWYLHVLFGDYDNKVCLGMTVVTPLTIALSDRLFISPCLSSVRETREYVEVRETGGERVCGLRRVVVDDVIRWQILRERRNPRRRLPRTREKREWPKGAESHCNWGLVLFLEKWAGKEL